MFKRESPQCAKNFSTKIVVQIKDRYTVEYSSDKIRAEVEVDFGSSVGVYSNSLKSLDSRVSIGEVLKSNIIADIKAGLEALGSKVEIL